jgi:ArsR family transcriptional regulator
MELDASVHILSALAHASRLSVFRLLVQAGEAGLAAGEIARRAGIVPSTLSTHLAVLTQAGLIAARRDGRLIIYTADYARMRELLGFLLEDCCGGAPEVCAPLAEIAARAACCPAG